MILVDTHVVAWLAFDQDQISKKARSAIDDARKRRLAISDITLLQVATLVRKGRIRLDIQNPSCRKSRLGSLFCNKWPGVRSRYGISRELSQRPSIWGYCVGRGALFLTRRPWDPSVENGSDDLVRTITLA